MIEHQYNIVDPEKILAGFLEANQQGYRELRLRAVLNYSNSKWELVSCVIEAITSDTIPVGRVSSRHYPQAILFEEWLTNQACSKLMIQIAEGRMHFGDLIVQTTETRQQWDMEQVALSNHHMFRAGHVLSTRFNSRLSGMYSALVTTDQPYYPDLAEAARYWLPFPVYHGNSDSHNGHIVFFLPETRAYLVNTLPKGETLEVEIAGTQINQLALFLKGAWWAEDGIHHIEEPVTKGHAELHIPENVDRLEYVLMGSNGTIYDFQREDIYRHTGLGRKRLLGADSTLVAIVQEVCRDGEGLKVEFKPFIELNGGYKKTKLGELVETIVAFANAQGGRIFLGIDDSCSLLGIDEKLAEWVKNSPDDNACEEYLGALRGKIRDVVVGDPSVRFLQTVVEDRRIAIIEVAEAQNRPIYIRQDNNLYIRRGASNAKAMPGEWNNIICQKRTNFPA
ncbi:helix-turn-helix domain-containing protein [Sulfuricaulis sp.]|jgi:hypothetical protein|uniref:AlbA family DNA-binding domain-containing protein n=1 Tax=Sulfuricaulis sp. TaxID=2003553 RepID=UPI003559F567